MSEKVRGKGRIEGINRSDLGRRGGLIFKRKRGGIHTHKRGREMIQRKEEKSA